MNSPEVDPASPADPAASASEASTGRRGWSGSTEKPTTLVVVRHGVTLHTAAKRFSGGLGGDNPGLAEEGRAQVRQSARWLAPLADRIETVIASPVRRTRESAEIVAGVLGARVVEEAGFAEMEFGVWDGLSFAEVGQRHPEEMKRWLGDLDLAPGGGESFRTVQTRVLAGLERTLAAHRGHTVAVVSHVTPIKILVAQAVGAPLDAVFRMELSPASVTVLSYFADGRCSMRLFNALPPARDQFAAAGW